MSQNITGIPTIYWDILGFCGLAAYFVMIWRQANPDRWMVFQFILSVIGGGLFLLAWNTVGPGAHPLGQEGKLLPIFVLIAGYWFNKAIMFCIFWARFGLASARTMRMLD